MKLFYILIFISTLSSNSYASESLNTIKNYFSCDRIQDGDVAHQKDCRFLIENLKRDTDKDRPDPELIFKGTNNEISPTIAWGFIRYMGFWPKRYHYSVQKESNGNMHVEVKVYIKNAKNFSQPEIATLQNKLNTAAGIWQQYSNSLPVTFNFKITAKHGSDYNVRLTRNPSRGPYNVEWSTLWSASALAHEIGHMMGLEDEYDLLSTMFKKEAPPSAYDQCNKESLMCSTRNWSAPRPYHYYLILRRLVANDPTVENIL